MEKNVMKSEKRYNPHVLTAGCVLFMVLFTAGEVTDLVRAVEAQRAGDAAFGAFFLEQLEAFLPTLLIIGVFVGIIFFNYASARELLVIDGEKLSVTNMFGVTESFSVGEITKVETMGNSLRVFRPGRKHVILELKNAKQLKQILAEKMEKASAPETSDSD